MNIIDTLDAEGAKQSNVNPDTETLIEMFGY
jgi:hypothetical protein